MATKYAADIEAIRRTVEGIAHAVTGIQSLAERTARIEDKLDDLAQTNAAMLQWREDHEKAHEQIASDMRTQNQRLWALGGGGGLLSLIAFILNVIGIGQH